MDIPTDLMPLPTAPYSERPVELALDVEECRTALWRSAGNITEAAKLIKVTSLRLRNFVNKSPYLTAEMQEAKDQIVDKAEAVVVAALDDTEDKSRQDTMARFVLGSQGRARGWGTGVGNSVKVNNTKGGTIIVQWGDGTALGQDNDDSEIIDVTPEKDEVA